MYWSSRRRPLDHDIEVTGPASVADTDFTQKLIDVYPPSADLSHAFAMNPPTGCRRTLSRKLETADSDGAGRGLCDHDRAVPGRQFALSAAPVSARHIEQQFPHFDVNLNSGEPTE
jgi:hypothetical protein